MIYYIVCNVCKEVRRMDMPPCPFYQFTTNCPYCKKTTMHRFATFDEVVDYKDSLEGA